MRVGCCINTFQKPLREGDLSLIEAIDLCRKTGFDGVELSSEFFPATEDSVLHQIKRHMLKSGLTITSTSVGNKFTSPDSTIREQQIALVKEWIEHSFRLGSPALRVYGGPLPEGYAMEQVLDWTISCLQDCVRHAADHGVVLALENHPGITATADQVIQILEAVDSDWVAVNLDTGNYRVAPYDEISRTAKYTVTTHVKPELRHNDSTTTPVDVPRLVSILRQAGYHGFLNVQYLGKDDLDTVVPSFGRKLREEISKQ